MECIVFDAVACTRGEITARASQQFFMLLLFFVFFLFRSRSIQKFGNAIDLDDVWLLPVVRPSSVPFHYEQNDPAFGSFASEIILL